MLLGVFSQIYCGCGAFPAVDNAVADSSPCCDAIQRDLKTTDVLHGRLVAASLRAFDPDTGSFTLAARPVTLDSDAGADASADEPVTVTFLPSDQLRNRPTGLGDFQALIRSARPGTLFTFAGRWITHSWTSRSGAIVTEREFQATRFAQGWHSLDGLCGVAPDGTATCPARAAAALLQAHLPSPVGADCSRPLDAAPRGPAPRDPFPWRAGPGADAADYHRPIRPIRVYRRIALDPPLPPAAWLEPTAQPRLRAEPLPLQTERAALAQACCDAPGCAHAEA